VAVARFYTWDHLGRPITPAKPIEELVGRLKVAFPRAAGLFSWFADDSHYESNTPQDHTPFSVDGWPKPDPEWWVCATDIMHRPDLGVDCFKLFPYYLAEAKSGRAPWMKYLIWQAKIYDVRHDWVAQANSDHFDHIHISSRTDYLNYHLGAWSVVPEDDMNADQFLALLKDPNVSAYFRAVGLQYNGRGIGENNGTDVQRSLLSYLNEILMDVRRIPAEPPVNGGGDGSGLTPDQIRAIVREELDKTRLNGP